ncbi:MAG: PAS domain S-box protein [Ignavibacteria bacterium]|nr:PAS domain S-box protein [Ignavibacteria bacterium]
MVELANSRWVDFFNLILKNNYLNTNFPEIIQFLKENQEKFKIEEIGFAKFPLPLFVCTKEKIIQKVNEKFLEFFIKTDINEIIGKNLAELELHIDENILESSAESLVEQKWKFENLPFPKNVELKIMLYKIYRNGDEFYIGVILYNIDQEKEYFQILKIFEELKLILNNIPYVVYLKDKQNRIIKVNHIFCSKFELISKDVENKFADSVFSEEVVKKCIEKERQVFTTQKPVTGSEERFTINSKIENYFIVERIPLFYEQKVIGILVFAYDITEKKKTEIELRRWKKRFDFATTETGQAVFERDWNTGQVIWTDNIKDLFGYSPKELKNREKWYEKILPADIENYLSTFRKHCENLSPYNLIYRIIDSEGKQRYVKESGFFLTDEGKIISIVGIVSDITDRVDLEQKVSDYNTFLHVLLDTIPMPIFYEDTEGKIVGCNKSFQENIIQLNKKEFLGKQVDDFPHIFTPDFIAKHKETNKKLIQKEKVETYDTKIALPNKIEKDFAIFKASYKDFVGNLAGIICILIDITDRKKAEEELRNLNIQLEKKIEERTQDLQTALDEYKFEVEEHRRVQEILEQANYELKILNETLAEESRKLIVLNEKLAKSEAELREANSAKDKFFSIIAHDLRNPLQSILTDAEILDRFFDTFSPEKIKEYVKHIYKTSTLLKNLLENLLTWAKTQTGRIVFRPEWININLLLNDIVRYIEPSAKNKNIEIIYDKTLDFMAYLDRNMITTIMRNLLSNAIKFSYRNSKVNIEIENFYDGNIPSLKISVKDEGIGIPKEQQDKIFRIEHSISTVGTEKEQGTGLGLILCYELIKLHGGKIWVESEVGKGTKFTFIIPINFD